MIFTKGAHQSVKFQKTFEAQVKFHQIWTFAGSFCWKYIRFQLKSYRGVMTVCYYHVTYAIQSESTLYSCLSVKELLAWNRKNPVRRVMSHDTEDWCKIWRKTDFLLQNDKNLVNFDTSTQKSQKFALWLVPFMQII